MTLRRVPVWVGYTAPSDQETAAGIDDTDVLPVGLVLDGSTGTVRVSDGRTEYQDLPEAGSVLASLEVTGGIVSSQGTGRVELGENSAGDSEVAVFGPTATTRQLAALTSFNPGDGNHVGFFVLDEEGGSSSPFGMVKGGPAEASLAGTWKITGAPDADAASDLVPLSQVQSIADAKVAASTYDAHTILAATTDNTPAALTVGEDRMVGRVAGGNIVALTPAQIRTLTGLASAQAPVYDNGAAVSNTTAETTLLAGTVNVGANVAAVNDEFDFEACGIAVNLGGSSYTMRTRFKVGGTTLVDQTYTLASFAGLQWRVRARISFEALSPSPVIWAEATIDSAAQPSGVGATFTAVTATPGLAHATTSAIAVALTTTHNNNAVLNECYRATLRARPRI